MSKEKFVRDKPHVNIGLIVGLFILGFAAASILTYLYPDSIFPAYALLSSGTSSLRDSSLHTMRVLLNGAIYGGILVLATTIIVKGKKILQN
ncbi:hypothetical protein EU528_14355 [Candidatus Thorarchaeota archaeon]|nr:MAG: hypothetical protein EU528_14355 [Candidatus Thorarchaeota archaeon]